MLRKISLFIVVVLFHNLLAIGQDNTPSFQTPNVANIIRYVDFPVNKGTGVPNISIPIYTIQDKSFSFPISVSYNASGIKVEELASNVGLGWALIADGVITRSIKGYPDEIGWYMNHGPVPYRTPVGTFDEFGNVLAWSNLMQTYEDSEPDIYTFSVNGYSGKFVFDTNRNVRLIPEQDIRIEVLDTSALTSFKITTPDGAQYVISGFDEYCDVYDGISETGHMWPTGLHLSYIITPSHHKIEFEYIAEYSDFHKVATHGSGSLGAGHVPNAYLPPHNVEIHGYKISKIKSDLAVIDFRYKNAAREDCNCSGTGNGIGALDTIRIKDTMSNLVLKQFKFNTSYFTSNTTSYFAATDTYLNKRLRLDEIKECDGDTTCLPSYKFSYNKYNKTTYDYLPNKISFGQDAWGFYNGADDNHSLYPTLRDNSNTVLYTGYDRSSKEEYAKAFILDEIAFPTGGVTSFFYESVKNQNNFYPFTTEVLGGLRIKQVVSTPANGQLPSIKEYSYNGAYVVGLSPTYVLPIAESDLAPNYEDNDPPCGGTFIPAPTLWAFTDPVITSSGITSQYIFYDKVTESTPGQGSIESFYNIEDLQDEVAPLYEAVWPMFPTSPLISAGKLIREVYKDEKGNPKKETDYTYFKHFGGPAVDNAYKIFQPFCFQKARLYSISSGTAYLAEKREALYDENGGEVETITNYEYGIPAAPLIASPAHHFPLKEITRISDSSLTIKRYKYPLDYNIEISGAGSSDTWDTTSLGIRQAIKDYRIGTPVEQIITRKDNTTEMITAATLTQYKAGKSSVDSIALLDRVSTLRIDHPITFDSSFISYISKSGSTYHFISDTNYVVDANILKYDSLNNIVDIKGKDGLEKSFIWGYKKNYLIAQIDNAKSSDVFYTSFEDSTGASIATDGKTGVKSKTGGFSKPLSGLTNGSYTLSYWSKSGGVWTFQQSQVSVSSNTYTISLSGQVDEIRFHPVSSFVSSATYNPLMGISAMNDLNNSITKYEYDNFQRLTRIRDKDSAIQKQFAYSYQNISNRPLWYETGATRCKRCNVDTVFSQSISQKELKDTNIYSPTYDKSIWLDNGPSLTCEASSNTWAYTDSAERCGRDMYNIYTGYKEKQIKYNDPCGMYYMQTRWMPYELDTTSCTVPIPYARLEFGSISYFESEADADLEVHYYSDSACTHPYELPIETTVNFNRTNDCTTTTGYTIYDTFGNYYTLIPMTALYYIDEYDHTCTITFTLLTGTRYIVRN